MLVFTVCLCVRESQTSPKVDDEQSGSATEKKQKQRKKKKLSKVE